MRSVLKFPGCFYGDCVFWKGGRPREDHQLHGGGTIYAASIEIPKKISRFWFYECSNVFIYRKTWFCFYDIPWAGARPVWPMHPWLRQNQQFILHKRKRVIDWAATSSIITRVRIRILYLMPFVSLEKFLGRMLRTATKKRMPYHV